MTRSSEVLIGSPILTRETRTRDAIKPSFRAGHFRCWPHCGHGIGFGGCRLLTLNERRQLVSHTIVWPHPTGNAGYATAAIARSISGASVACAA